MNKSVRIILIILVLAIGGIGSVLIERYAYLINDGFGFPLDDPWIHLQFAKNMHDYGSFSYYKNEIVTSGSTSPLYTFLLAIGFFITSNEMVLSYVLGISFLLISAFFIYKLTDLYYPEKILFPIIASLLLVLEPRLQWAALSGMETTMFIAILISTAYYYQKKNIFLFGMTSGLLLWARPEAVIFFVVIIIDVLYNEYIVKLPVIKGKKSQTKTNRWLFRSVWIILFFGILYIGFNLWLSGSIFPNTYSAKIKYYSQGGQNFPERFFHFLTDGHLIIFSIFFLVGAISVIFKIIKRERSLNFIPFLWCVGLFLAYWKNLPYLYQEGRYLMPLLPFYILIGINGIDISLTVMKKLFKKQRTLLIASSFILIVFTYQFGNSTWEFRKNYAESCKYISDRQVRAGKWLSVNVPNDAIIATHDIGAISFYSKRKIVDMVGLVSPEMIKNIGNLDKLKDFILNKRVTHIAVLRNWFEISNQNPIFQTDNRKPEIMEIFNYDPKQTHFVPRNVSDMLNAGRYYLSSGNISQAGPLLEYAVRSDPQSATAHFLLGYAHFHDKNFDHAREEITKAVQLHPDFWDAYMVLADVAVQKKQPEEAIKQIEKVITMNPSYVEGYEALAKVYDSFNLDDAKANDYRQRYQELLRHSSR